MAFTRIGFQTIIEDILLSLHDWMHIIGQYVPSKITSCFWLLGILIKIYKDYKKKKAKKEIQCGETQTATAPCSVLTPNEKYWCTNSKNKIYNDTCWRQ